MLKKTIFQNIICVLVLLLFFSCASAPEPIEAPPDAEKAEATALRGTVINFQLGEVMPDEYSEAESLFTSAEQAYNADPALAKSNYIEASAIYRNIIDQGLESVVSQLRTRIQNKKDDAIAIRADVTQKDTMDAAHEAQNMAETLYSAESYNEAIEAFKEANLLYEEAFEQTKELREKALSALQKADKQSEDAESKIRELESEADGLGGDE